MKEIITNWIINNAPAIIPYNILIVWGYTVITWSLLIRI